MFSKAAIQEDIQTTNSMKKVKRQGLMLKLIFDLALRISVDRE